MPIVLILNNTIEGRASAPPEHSMPEYKAGPIRRRPTHPGVVVKSNLEALDLTPYAAAPLLGVTKQALGNIIAGKSAVSPAMALRLGKFFGNGPGLWINMQVAYDLWNAKQELKGELAKIKAVWTPPDPIPEE